MCQNSKAVGLAKRKVNWAREKIFYPPSPHLVLLIEGQPEEFLILLPILLPLYNDKIKDGGHGNMNIHKQLKSFYSPHEIHLHCRPYSFVSDADNFIIVFTKVSYSLFSPKTTKKWVT